MPPSLLLAMMAVVHQGILVGIENPLVELGGNSYADEGRTKLDSSPKSGSDFGL